MYFKTSAEQFRYKRTRGPLLVRNGYQCAAAFHHQIIFNASCNCLDVVTVEEITPAFGSRVPPAVKMLSFVKTGRAKLARLKTLKTSNRIWALKVSEILW